MSVIINTANMFFKMFGNSILQLSEEDPLCVVTVKSFKSHVNAAMHFEDIALSGTALRAYKWVEDKLNKIEEELVIGRLDAWSDQITIRRWYEKITLEEYLKYSRMSVLEDRYQKITDKIKKLEEDGVHWSDNNMIYWNRKAETYAMAKAKDITVKELENDLQWSEYLDTVYGAPNPFADIDYNL